MQNADSQLATICEFAYIMCRAGDVHFWVADVSAYSCISAPSGATSFALLRIPNSLRADGGSCSWVMLSAKELPPKGSDYNSSRNISFRQKSRADLSCIVFVVLHTNVTWNTHSEST